MKKILLAGLIVFSLYSCKKSGSSSPKTNSWIGGKWKREDLIDTIFNGNIIAGIDNFNINLNQAELNFTSDNSGTSSIPAYGTFTYSLSTNLLTYGNGAVWSIVKISDTRFKLIMHSFGVGRNDSYVKE